MDIWGPLPLGLAGLRNGIWRAGEWVSESNGWGYEKPGESGRLEARGLLGSWR